MDDDERPDAARLRLSPHPPAAPSSPDARRPRRKKSDLSVRSQMGTRGRDDSLGAVEAVDKARCRWTQKPPCHEQRESVTGEGRSAILGQADGTGQGA